MRKPFLLEKENPNAASYRKVAYLDGKRKYRDRIEEEGTRKSRTLSVQKESSVPSCRGRNQGFSSKGQMFLIAGILIIISLVLLSNLLGVFSTAQEGEVVEGITVSAEIRNIKSEYNYIPGIAMQQPVPNASAIDSFYNISDLLRNDKDIEIIYMLAFVNGTDGTYTVTVGNFLNDKINLTVNVTDSTALGYSFGIVSDKTNVTNEFTPDSSDQTVSITLNYTIQNTNVTELITANISTNNHFSLFYDMKLKSNDFFVRTKDIYNTTW